MESEFVVLNLRGKKFEVLKETFEKFNLDKVKHRKISDNEYYISRDASVFNYVLNYVEYGTLQCPDSVRTMVVNELIVYDFCYCMGNGCPVECSRGKRIFFERHKKLCNKGPSEVQHKSCNW